MPHRLGNWHSEREPNGVLHLIPDDDTAEHTLNACFCKPDIDFYVVGPDQEVCIMTHNSNDHREDRFRNNEQ